MISSDIHACKCTPLLISHLSNVRESIHRDAHAVFRRKGRMEYLHEGGTKNVQWGVNPANSIEK